MITAAKSSPEWSEPYRQERSGSGPRQPADFCSRTVAAPVPSSEEIQTSKSPYVNREAKPHRIPCVQAQTSHKPTTERNRQEKPFYHVEGLRCLHDIRHYMSI